jgi:3D (Asp-Asp-Asp) domain-containing protein
MSEDALCGMDVVECSENLTSASPKGLARAIEATVTTYQAVSSQTDASPCIAASGLHVCPPPYPVVATNILPLGAKVKIRGQVYVVADRMNHRYDGVRIFDVLTDGENYILKNEPVTVL